MSETSVRIGEILRQRQMTLCVAESVTCGRFQSLIGTAPGASDYFVGGITAYTIKQKVRHLRVDREEAEATNCVSPRVCRQMAVGACRLFRADLGLATTGYAEPSEEDHVAKPFAHISIWRASIESVESGEELLSSRVECPREESLGDRCQRRRQCQCHIADAALDALLEALRRG